MRQFTKAAIAVLTCGSVALGACTVVGDKIDEACESGVLTTTQGYVDTFNESLAEKGRKFRIDGITCLE